MQTSLRVLDLGHREYQSALELQERLVEQRRSGAIPDTLLLVEHEPVYTLGRNAKEDNILASEMELEQMGVRVVKTGRGGDVTYHGPGQLVGYPIMDLGARGQGVLWYVSSLETVLVRVLAEFGINGTTDRRNRGVWVGNEKVAAIGVRVTHQVTMHGFSLNVCADMKYYKGIIPCGIRDKGVTSLHLLAQGVSMDDVTSIVVAKFAEVFGYNEIVRDKE